MKNAPDLPPIWLLGTMATSWAIGRFVPVAGLGAFGDWLGAALIGASLALILWAGVWFWRKKTPIEPHHAPKALIVEGPYRVSRNPIYLALVVIALGYALRQPSILALLPVPALWWVLDRRFAQVEEAGLRRAFGPAAETYLAQSRRWL
ncbi:S-isoprenylcysteine methyltransferase [Jannaschia pagri]|uniref:S-isoprenylcysteine methyltransferase n=1 Tax=Jannaschia pagri TaxID=2829797 RepID=A0ABQ4NFZ8_9RHOB|nr:MULTISPECIES: isoprenylcysteine carboxylmethyltransferase family protein [unclassified Jannaschia]GIT90512.1 S-isoprenylcysteine methyltransferase [Jannaschia sp. AI_61]GIT93383.1 S-isoprenylcysteine methyltransferase [Jannaschia sp. AI_62]